MERAGQSTYIAFRDGPDARCPGVRKLGDKKRGDINHGGPTLFALYQTVRLDVHAKVPRQLGEAREAALMRKISPRLPS